MSHITFNLHFMLRRLVLFMFSWLFGLDLLRLVYSVFAHLLLFFAFKLFLRLLCILQILALYHMYGKYTFLMYYCLLIFIIGSSGN